MNQQVPTVPHGDAADETSRARFDIALRQLLAGNKAILFTVLLAIALSFASPYFLTSRNIFDVLDQIAAMTLVALAYTLVLGCGEIDLSIGGIIGLTGVVLGKILTETGLPVPLAIVVALVFGSLCGLLNAGVISLFGLPPFIVTLATNSVFTGIIYIVTNLLPIYNLPASFNSIESFVGPVPVSVFILAPFIVAFYFVARSTVFGLHVVALGGSREAVRVAGININGVRLRVYALTGFSCAAAAVLETARAASAQLATGSDLLLLVIAAVVVGGTPLVGGKANIIGTVFGCLIIGMINNGVTLLGMNPNYNVIVQGVVILLALVLDVQSTRFLLGVAKRNMRRQQAGRR